MKTKSPTEDNSNGERLSRSFYTRDVLEVAPDLIGKSLVIRTGNNPPARFIISEVEAYRGSEDRACHANKGRTSRTEVMYHVGGKVYIYLVYGMYWMLNVVTSTENNPQAVLIRGVKEINGPGKLTRQLSLNGDYYGEDLVSSEKIWLEDTGYKPEFRRGSRIGISYAGEPWISKPWRYYL